jgi:hypothetical protein
MNPFGLKRQALLDRRFIILSCLLALPHLTVQAIVRQ